MRAQTVGDCPWHFGSRHAEALGGQTLVLGELPPLVAGAVVITPQQVSQATSVNDRAQLGNFNSVGGECNAHPGGS